MTTQDLSEQQQYRRAKRQKLIDSGREAYPVVVDRTDSLSDVRARYAVAAEGETAPEGATVLEAGQ